MVFIKLRIRVIGTILNTAEKKMQKSLGLLQIKTQKPTVIRLVYKLVNEIKIKCFKIYFHLKMSQFGFSISLFN